MGFSYGTAAEPGGSRAGQEEAPIDPLSKERSSEGGLDTGCLGLFSFLGLCF